MHGYKWPINAAIFADQCGLLCCIGLCHLLGRRVLSLNRLFQLPLRNGGLRNSPA